MDIWFSLVEVIEFAGFTDEHFNVDLCVNVLVSWKRRFLSISVYIRVELNLFWEQNIWLYCCEEFTFFSLRLIVTRTYVLMWMGWIGYHLCMCVMLNLFCKCWILHLYNLFCERDTSFTLICGLVLMCGWLYVSSCVCVLC